MTESLKLIDAVCEIVDARIPEVSRNPDLDELTRGKPRIILLSRIDQAQPEETAKWVAYFRKKGNAVLEINAKTGQGVDKFPSAIKSLMADKIKKQNEKGMTGRGIRVMVAGIPNVGKSSFINKVIGKKRAIASDRPGVTRGQQWFSVQGGIELLDTPGILWPKLDDEKTGLYLAFTGAIKDDILDTETLAAKLMDSLKTRCPGAIRDRYKIDFDPDADGFSILTLAAKRRGFLISGGEIDTERMGKILLDEFRGGKLGRITLESPEDYE